MMFGCTGDASAAIGVVQEALQRASTSRLRSLDHIRILICIVSMTPDESLATASEYLENDDVDHFDRTAVEGLLSLILAILGEVDQATVFAAALRDHVAQARLSFDKEAGFYGGGLAALFSGDAIEATRLVTEGARVPTSVDEVDSPAGRPSMACTMGPPRGHCRTGMADFVKQVDAAGSLGDGVITRIYAVWELALRRDPRADELWQQLQAAPEHLRGGPRFLEAIAGVALLASHDEVTGAAETALAGAELLAPARSAAAWLLHDAARHGRPGEAVGSLEAIAASQTGRFLPAVFADSARAMHAQDPDHLIATASEFRSGGFDLFAAELEVITIDAVDSSSGSSDRNQCLTRARQDLARPGGPWTPIIGTLQRGRLAELHRESGRLAERHRERGRLAERLTERQLEICRLVTRGHSNAEIAQRLGISKRTVENQLHRSYAELGVDRAGLSTLEL